MVELLTPRHKFVISLIQSLRLLWKNKHIYSCCGITTDDAWQISAYCLVWASNRYESTNVEAGWLIVAIRICFHFFFITLQEWTLSISCCAVYIRDLQNGFSIAVHFQTLHFHCFGIEDVCYFSQSLVAGYRNCHIVITLDKLCNNLVCYLLCSFVNLKELIYYY